MPTIIVKTQAEIDALPASFEVFTTVEIRGGSPYTPLVLRKNPESSHVEARESSHVVARGSSHVEARESSHVEAWESSHVVARGSSHVVARGSSHVEAWGSCAVHNHTEYTTLELFAFSAAWLIAKTAKLTRHGKHTTVIEPQSAKGTAGWLEANAVAPKAGKVVLFKRVSKDWKTQENTTNETLWTVGTTLDHPNWNPADQECGPGKYHACSRPYFCDDFRSAPGDRYVAIQVAVSDLHAWDGAEYPHKVAFRKGTVLHECDRYGAEITP